MDDGYRSSVRQALNNDEPEESPVVEFGVQLFKLADGLNELEKDLAKHQLRFFGLHPNGLRDLEERHDDLTVRFNKYQEVLSNPPEKFQEMESGVSDDDATRLKEEHHSWGNFEHVLNQIRDTQNRTVSKINSKKSRRNAAWGVLVSVIIASFAGMALI